MSEEPPATDAEPAAVPEPEPPFVCECVENVRSACNGLPFYKEHEGKRYCVLHYPSVDKFCEFNEVLERKIKSRDFNFRGVWFPDHVSFNKQAFNEGMEFGKAVFKGMADFSGSTFFAEVDFMNAIFEEHALFFHSVF